MGKPLAVLEGAPQRDIKERMLCPVTLVTRGCQRLALVTERHGPQCSGMCGDDADVVGGQFDKSSESGDPVCASDMQIKSWKLSAVSQSADPRSRIPPRRDWRTALASAGPQLPALAEDLLSPRANNSVNLRSPITGQGEEVHSVTS